MSPDLDAALCTKYPEIFRDRHVPISGSAMPWGFCCGDGWYPLIDTLCALLSQELRDAENACDHARQMLATIERGDDVTDWARSYYTLARLMQREHDLNQAREKVPVATQVKEKFGTLCFYVQDASPLHAAYIDAIEAMSTRTCEVCGATKDAKPRNHRGWIKTTCPACHALRESEDANSL